MRSAARAKGSEMIDTEALKAQFERRLATLKTRVKELQGELRSSHDPDSEERAKEIEGDEVLEGLESSALQEIAQIDAALARIAAGTYGACEGCGEPIDEQRLRALPYAARCIECAGEA